MQISNFTKNYEYKTIFNIRYELRIIGFNNIHYYSDIEVVKLYNNHFSNDINYIGIDKAGQLINYLL